MDDVSRIGTLVKRLQARHHAAGNAALADLGVSIVQWDALRRIEDHPGASLHDLARLTFQSDQSFGTLSTRMRARGLVERDAGSGRAVQLRLTSEGARVLRAGTARIDGMLRRSLAALSDEDAAGFERALERLLESEPD